MKKMKTYKDFVLRYWIVLLAIITIILMIIIFSEYGSAAEVVAWT